MVSCLSPEGRRTLARGMVKNGVPFDRASLIVDIAAQACDQAFDTMARSVGLAPDIGSKLAATEIGAQLLAHEMKQLLAGTAVLSKRYGLPTRNVEVSGR